MHIFDIATEEYVIRNESYGIQKNLKCIIVDIVYKENKTRTYIKN